MRRASGQLRFTPARREREGAIFSRLFRFAERLDRVQIVSLAVLLGIGLVFVRSIGIQIGTPAALGFFSRQLQWIGVGLLLWMVLAMIDYRKLTFRAFSVLFYFISLVALVLVLFIGVKVNGAVSWLSLPGIGIRLQPSEFSKLALILLLSAMFSTRIFSINDFRCVLTAAAASGAPFLLIIAEPDFGSAMVLIPILLGTVFVSGLKWRYILLAITLTALLATAAAVNEIFRIHPFLKEYQRARITVFIDPETDLLRRGYNQYQARLAVGSGGFTGKGIGEGTQNSLGFLPQNVSNNDFIFSVIAEETGFAGCTLLLAAYIGLFYSMLKTAMTAADRFGRYIAVGCGCMFFPHVFVNIGMCIGLSPVTGVPLPFISYGGSFMLTGMAAMGILQSIRRYSSEE